MTVGMAYKLLHSGGETGDLVVVVVMMEEEEEEGEEEKV